MMEVKDKMENFIKSLRGKSDDFNYASICHINSRGHEPILITPDGVFAYKAQCFEICGSQRCIYDQGGQY